MSDENDDRSDTFWEEDGKTTRSVLWAVAFAVVGLAVVCGGCCFGCVYLLVNGGPS